MDRVKRLLKKMMGKLPYQYIHKNPERFCIVNSAIILDNAVFDFRVPRDNTKSSIIIGENSMLGCNFVFESSQGIIKIGQCTYIGGGTNLISRSSIEIGNDVTIGWGCYIYDHNSHSLFCHERCNDIKIQNDNFRNGRDMVWNKNWDVVISEPIKICDKAWIGFEAVILKGVTIGEGAIVGARAVVTKDVEPWTVVAGNPAKMVKKLEIG